MFSISDFLDFISEGCILSFTENDLCLGWGDSYISDVASPDRLSLYAPDFFLRDSHPWRIFPHSVRLTRADLMGTIATAGNTSLGNFFKFFQPDFTAFKKAFLNLKETFPGGTLRKAVPVVMEHGQGEVSPLSILSSCLSYTEGWPLRLYGYWNPSEGILGATPEILFQTQGEGFHTAALAGTHLRGEEAQLIKDPKELEEHRIVVAGICEALQDYDLQVGETAVLKLPTLSHLFTPIFSPVFPGFTELVARLHPTPALGAFPREAGRKWLETFANPPGRGRFGAPFGILLNTGEVSCVVSIRNIQWENDQVRIGAGCGVVPASDLNREKAEILAKISSVKKVLGLE